MPFIDIKYDPNKQYTAKVTERVPLPQWQTTLYPGKIYVLSGDFLNSIADRVSEATPTA